MPTISGWALHGHRKRVKYDYPQGQRVYILAEYMPYGALRCLDALPFDPTLANADLKSLPLAALRLVVLDKA